MKTLATTFRHLLLATALPAAFAFSACGNDDDDPVAPQQGKVLVVHAAASAPVKVKVLIDDKEVKELNYGENSGYQTVQAGSRSVKINVASNGTNAIATTQNVVKDKTYSVFAYSPASQTGSAAGLAVEDDLTAPTAGKAKIRLVHVALGAPSPVTLNKSETTGNPTVLAQNVSFGNASAFTEVAAGDASLYLSGSSGSPIPPFINKSLTAGKIYTVVVQGSTTAGTIDPSLGVKVTFIENN